MKNVLLLLVLLSVFLSCNDQEIKKYFGRPDLPSCVSIGDGKSYCVSDTEEGYVDNTNHLTISPQNYDVLERYYKDKELRLYICLKYPKRCK